MKKLTLLFAILFVCSITKAAIVHTDINPDTTISSGTYALDLNGDGTTDFNIEHNHFSGGPSYTNTNKIFPLNSNEILSQQTVKIHCPLALNYNDPISSVQITWFTSTSLILGGYSDDIKFLCSYWDGPIDKYLGLRFRISGQWHYGWVRLETDLTSSFLRIKEYAYQNTPGLSILAGNTFVNIKENSVNDISIYSTNKTLYINLNDAEIQNGNVKLYNLTGQEVRSFNIVQNKMTYNLDDISTGIYLLTIYNNEESIITRKISIK